ncbi:carbohydrate ABC transporter permease [Kribbella solani]|uniref:carbohydrate ABC transporter permease n=1 Tax=Kribbella solani TaxID=236067 RepID=UPI0029BA5328|nr:hypothetical protein [Kribbella solani]MDX2971945.1 hypothetical protein [Kribbella solani]
MATATVAAAPAVRTGKQPGIRPSGWVGFLFIAPNLLGVVAFTLIPLISVVVLAFTDWNLVSGLGGITFTGVDNFVAIARDPGFWHAIALTLAYVAVSVPLTVILGLGLGIALNRPLPAVPYCGRSSSSRTS